MPGDVFVDLALPAQQHDEVSARCLLLNLARCPSSLVCFMILAVKITQQLETV